MMWLYNVARAVARGLAAGAVGVLLNGKAEAFGVRFDATNATLLGVALLLAAILAFQVESVLKKKCGL
jgi:hypothetical protein